MTALTEALTATQARAIAALQRNYAAGTLAAAYPYPDANGGTE